MHESTKTSNSLESRADYGKGLKLSGMGLT